MRVEIKNSLGKEAAINKIDGTIESLRARALPSGVEVSEFTKAWTDNVLNVSARAGKGFFKATVAAKATVEEDKVIVEIELPAMMKALLPAEKIEEGVRGGLTPLLNGGSSCA